MAIRFNNRARHVGKRGDYDYFDWKVYVDEPSNVLDRIDYVVYFLHQTFPEPVRTVTSRESAFALESRGWGEFSIHIEIHYKDNTVENIDYWLDLSKPWT